MRRGTQWTRRMACGPEAAAARQTGARRAWEAAGLRTGTGGRHRPPARSCARPGEERSPATPMSAQPKRGLASARPPSPAPWAHARRQRLTTALFLKCLTFLKVF